MKTLIKSARVIYPGNAIHNKELNLLIENGKILQIDPANDVNHDKIIDAAGMLLFPSLVDTQCHTGEPGYEEKEDFETLTLAAKHGGFSQLFLMPTTNPVIDTKSAVLYVNKASGKNGVKLNAYGSISQNLEGKDLSGMYDMHTAGAIGFTDGKRPVSDVNLMKRALDYSKAFGAMICAFPNDTRLAPGGMVNESPANTTLGLKTSPALAEELMLNRDIYLAKYCNTMLHVSTISTAGSVKLIKQAKESGIDISCSVAMANLIFDEGALSQFDTNFKTNPPLRTPIDREALIKGIESGAIDMICSDHSPLTMEEKDVEFNQAQYGMTMLETLLSAYFMHLNKFIGWDQFIDSISLKPRKRFGLEMPIIKEGNSFEFTLFDPRAKWSYAGENIKSKSYNSPFLNKELLGRVVTMD